MTLAQSTPSAAGEVVLTADEIALAFEFSPLAAPPADPSNAVYESPAAARLGQALFFDNRLSGPGSISCATCHKPDLGWSDGRTLAKAVAPHPRHTMTLWNVAYNRWFFWDGRKDTLWSQALAPFEDPREHASSRLQVVHTIATDPDYVRAYQEIFGPLPNFNDTARFPPQGRPVEGEPRHEHNVAWESMEDDDRESVNQVFANLGKALAAFQRQIVSRRAPFDVFVEGLATGDLRKTRALSESAQRGFSLFVGKASCLVCHDGPTFSDLEFHTNLVPTEEGVDPGRALGVLRLQRDPFNSVSQYADDDAESGRTKLSLPKGKWHIPGEFKTPTLRNVAVTAPYMHEGQIKTLPEVLEFYSTLENAAAPGPHTEKILKPLHLQPEELADLLAFLESLTDEGIPDELLASPLTPYLSSAPTIADPVGK